MTNAVSYRLDSAVPHGEIDSALLHYPLNPSLYRSSKRSPPCSTLKASQTILFEPHCVCVTLLFYTSRVRDTKETSLE